MAAHANSGPMESEDAFSAIPDFTSKPHDTGTGYKKISVGKDLSSKTRYSGTGEQVSQETGTKIYLGKKITDPQESDHCGKLKDTTLTDVSIDTDFEGKSDSKEQEKEDLSRLSETTITTIESINENIIKKAKLAVEADSDQHKNIVASTDDTASVALVRKEKVSPSNITLDITPGEYQQKLPSGDESIPLGSGVIKGILGSGGMAKVYRIWNEKLEVYRAVKVLIPTSQKITWTRFLTEAKISAKLQHPNIIEVHSIGDWHGIPYIEMDVVEGETLNSMISRLKALPTMLVSAIAVQVARALSYAHCKEIVIYGKTYKGLIHRDLKPSNIMIGKNGSVKLMDFGVARPVETGLHTIDTENIVGTIHYFSPEQISGYPVDPLSDIYSFGAVIYEMLCGCNPFPQTSMIQLIRAKEKNQFIRLEEFQKPIDPRLASVAQVCLRTDKSSRYQSALELCNHLEEIHQILRIGSPEEVVVKFLQDPQKMYRESEELFQQFSMKQSRETATFNVEQKESDIEEIKSEDIPANVSSDDTSVENDSEYLREKRKRKSTFITIIVVLIILIIAGIIIFTNNLVLFSFDRSETDFFSLFCIGYQNLFRGFI